MTVADILKVKGLMVATAPPRASVGEICRVLAEKRIGAIVVTDEDGRIVGIASERDIVRALVEKGAGMLAEPVSTIMTRGVVTCGAEEKVDAIMRRMTEGKFRHVPVIDAAGRLVGIVSIGDVVKHRLVELEAEANAMRDYIVA